jgi:putative tryptophan/tyrosine transport system substrate-binding protein
LASTLEAKRIGLLHELVPRAATIGFLVNPNVPPAALQLADGQEAARTIGLDILVLRARTDGELDAVFQTIARERIAALAIAGDPFFDTRRDKLVALSAQYAVPTSHSFREFTESGGLMSYGIDISDVYRQVGVYAGRILKGAKPTELPVIQPTKFEFVINLKTAKALSLDVPPSLLAIADEVIE